MKVEREVVAEDPPQPVEQAFSEDGVDLTLIRWFLSLTPAERLDYFEKFVSDILEMRRAGTGL